MPKGRIFGVLKSGSDGGLGHPGLKLFFEDLCVLDRLLVIKNNSGSLVLFVTVEHVQHGPDGIFF